MPKSWREGDVKPIHKKGGEEKVENYRGITLMDIEYKIYTEILRQRLVKELEEKECLTDTQMGYRPGRGTIDAIYVLKTGVENEIRKDKGKAYVLFADVKGAFDRASREELWKRMEEKGIERQLRIRIMELYEKKLQNSHKE